MAARSPEVCRLIVLGSTGSIGTQTLAVVEHLNGLHARGAWPTRYEVAGLAAGKNVRLLGEQAAKFGVRDLAIRHDDVRDLALSEGTESFPGTLLRARHGDGSALTLVREVECDFVVAAMSGVAGLPATLAAVELGRDVALANKETLVAAGSLVVAAARKSGAKLLPVDSEHSGVWQCLGGTHEGTEARRHDDGAPPMAVGDEVRRVVLTASGGPFRMWPRERMERATVEEALKHPTWSMGRKVTIDSASLMNKALEVIEAHWLFGLPPEKIGVMIHPQSVVHAIVEFADGSVVAQMGAPDMRAPIQYALTRGQRAPGAARTIDLAALTKLEFEPVDPARFPGLGLAYRAIHEGNGAVLNAANEAAVQAFLSGKIAFTRIADLVGQAMEAVPVRSAASIEDVLAADGRAREYVAAAIATAS